MKLDPKIAALVARGALFVVNHSGGKDSHAMLDHLVKFVPADRLMVVHASLGEAEWPGALEKAETHADALGVPFVVARAVKTFFEMVEHKFATRPEVPSWPSAANRQCTSDLKRGPIEREVRRYAKEHGDTLIVNCVGIRAAESAARAKAETFKKNEGNSVAGREWYDWLPIHDWSTEKVWAELKKSPVEPHMAYALGNRRLSCVFCIMGHKNDLAIGAKHHPKLFEKLVEMEERTGYTMHMSRKSLKELVAEASVS